MSGEAPTNFHGTYRLVKNENMDEFLAANGVNWVIRKMALSSTPTLEVTQNGNKFHLKLASMVHTKENTFTVGEEFEETQPNGVVMKVMPTWEEGKVVMKYEPKVAGQGKSQTATREMNGDQLIMTVVIDNVIAKRIFERI